MLITLSAVVALFTFWYGFSKPFQLSFPKAFICHIDQHSLHPLYVQIHIKNNTIQDYLNYLQQQR